jgi:hypothetical protein
MTQKEAPEVSVTQELNNLFDYQIGFIYAVICFIETNFMV